MKRILSAILTLTMALSLTALPLFSANAEGDVTLTLDAKSSEKNFVAPDGAVANSWDANNGKYSSTMYIETVTAGAYVYFTGLEIPDAGSYTVLLDVRSQNDASFQIRIGTDFENAAVVGDLGILSSNKGGSGNCYEYTVGTVTLDAGEYSIYFYNNTSADAVLGAGKATLQDTTPRFAAGTVTPVTSSVKQEVEQDYTFCNADGTVEEKSYSNSSTSGWGGTISVFYSCPKNSYFEYTVTVPEDGTYTPGVLTRYHASGYGTWTVTVDGADVGTYESQYPGSGDYYAYITLNDIDLTAGDHTVRFTAQGAGAYGKADEDVFGCDYFDLTKKTSTFRLSTESLSAYTTTRVVSEGKFDVRFVLLAAEGNIQNGDIVTITFKDADGNPVFNVARTIGENMKLYTEVNAAGQTYIADENCQIFGCVVVDIPDNAFSTVTVRIQRSGADLAVGTQSYASLRG